MDKITIIVPCYNESESFPFLIPALNDTMNKMKEQEFEIILVDNCSEDDTLECMRKAHADDPRYQYISFSRNFGKDASMFAGLKKSTGDYVTVMDWDMVVGNHTALAFWEITSIACLTGCFPHLLYYLASILL